jgi:3-isopropylmalate/(R)-2-methylmalate dehydratase small subunit
MAKVQIIHSVPAPLPIEDVDTDVILPAQYLLRLDRTLGPFLFAGLRGKGEGQRIFVLDREQYRDSAILVAGARFGIGSSREHAVWALLDAGITCVIAPSFGDIFRLNARRNGLLLISLEPAEHAVILDAANQARLITVDLENCRIESADFATIIFEIDENYRRALLQGQDETGEIVEHYGAALSLFEARQAKAAPWIGVAPQIHQQLGFMTHVKD